MAESARPIRTLRRAAFAVVAASAVAAVVRIALFPINGQAVRQAVDEPTIQSWRALASAIRPSGTTAPAGAILRAPCLQSDQNQGYVVPRELDELDSRILALTKKFGEPPLRIDRSALDETLSTRADCELLARSLPRLLWDDLSRQQASGTLELLDWYFLHKYSDARARLTSGDYVRVPSRLLAKFNPWSEAQEGCLFAIGVGGRPTEVVLAGQRRRDCTEVATRLGGVPGASPAVLDVPDFATVLRPLGMLRRPGSVFLKHSGLVPEVSADEGPMRGLDMLLTLDPNWQASAQRLARCFVGEPAADCAGVVLPNETLVSGEPARMLAIALVDSGTGGVLALASASSRCLTATHRGQEAQDCPRLGNGRSYRPDRLENRAFFGEAMPASTVKPVMALGSLASPLPVNDAWLNHNLPSSISREFLRVFTCANLREGTRCEVPQLAQTAASELGWNRGCSHAPVHCGLSNFLLGSSLGSAPSSNPLVPELSERPRAFAVSAPAGTFMVQLDAGRGLRLIEQSALQGTNARRCGPRFTTAGCKVDDLDRAVINQGWGQGDLKSSPLGIAELYANLARAGEGNPPVAAHLVSEVYDAKGRQPLADILRGLRSGPSTAPSVATPERVQRVLQAMTMTHVRGTAATACVRLRDRGCLLLRGIQSKTASVTAPSCHKTPGCLAKLETAVQRGNYAEVQKVPYRWYAGVFEARGRKLAFAVLAERNWRTNGVIQSESENVAALAGLQLVLAGREAAGLAR